MTSEQKKSPGQLLAEAQEQQKILEQKIADLLKQTRAEDLATVKRLCKAHGFTATELKDVLKTRVKTADKNISNIKRKYTRKNI